jgi:hypothetical protein
MGFLFMAGIALASGLWEQYEPEMLIGQLLWALVFNCAMLPIAVVALWRYRRSVLHSDPPLDSGRPRGFEVQNVRKPSAPVGPE